MWFIAVGIFVYWGAAYPTLGNILTYIFDKLEPVGVVIDKYTNIAIMLARLDNIDIVRREICI